MGGDDEEAEKEKEGEEDSVHCDSFCSKVLAV